MFSDKLLSLLQTFTKVARNRFRKYLLSPYLNDQPDLIALFEHCERALRDGSYATMDRPQMWQKMYPGKSYNDAHLRRLASDLNIMALRFLAAEARIDSTLHEALDLQRLLEKPELKKHLAGIERNIEYLLEAMPGRSTEYYLAQFNFHNNISDRAAKHLAATGYAEKIVTADFYLECFYLSQKLELYIGWLLYRGARATEQDVSLPEGFWENLADTRFEKVPLLIVYRHVVQCLNEPENETHYKNLLDSLGAQARHLSKSDLRKCYFIAQNYCALKINQGKREYYREMFEIFKKLISLEILLEEGAISEGIFKNIVTVGLGVGEHRWTEEFIESYAPFLPSDIRENARMFNLAYLYFHQKNYKNVLELLQNVGYSDITYALGAKLILIQTYYELNETLALESLLDSFRIYVRRNKIMSKNLKREYTNYLNFVKKLMLLKSEGLRPTAKFREKIMGSSASTSKRWLLEKVDELAHRR